ncbi:hypothetical protein GCM10025771_38780 [Niveibacterium umoris]|uniref:Uncharacterized protein n=1 Tax=Niveibacterium umoris TaxID=1193620 RepID=A0A840BD12_9RHOO|nr:hypothetical protein [Niveibacterium umoris]MBB4010920.1 hypothetical protein [Niveibacterium umoris]
MLSQGVALGVTLLIEAPIVWFASARSRRGPAWRAAAALLPSCVTHPFAWQAIGHFGAHDYLVGLVLIEALVVLAEAVMVAVLAGLTPRVALLMSLAANLASALLGGLLA